MAKLVVAIGLVPEEMVGLVKLPTWLMVSVAGALAGQTPFFTVQVRVLVPLKPLMSEVGLLRSATLAEPTTFHVPKPEVGALAFRFSWVAQVVMVLANKLAADGVLSTLMSTSSA